MAGELEALLNEMKEKGIGGAVVRVDGVPVHSTIALNEVSSGLVSSLVNVSGALMDKMGDKQTNIEIAFDNAVLVLVPINNYIFCGMVSGPEQKKMLIEYAEKATPFLK